MGILPKNVCHGARLPRLFANNGMTSLGCHPVLPFGLYTAILRLLASPSRQVLNFTPKTAETLATARVSGVASFLATFFGTPGWIRTSGL